MHRFLGQTVGKLLVGTKVQLAPISFVQISDKTFDEGRLHVARLKNSDPSVHYLEGDEVRMLRKLQREFQSRHTYLKIPSTVASYKSIGPIDSLLNVLVMIIVVAVFNV